MKFKFENLIGRYIAFRRSYYASTHCNAPHNTITHAHFSKKFLVAPTKLHSRQQTLVLKNICNSHICYILKYKINTCICTSQTLKKT